MREGHGPAMGSLRDHLLVLRCQAGSEFAFAELYERNKAGTLGYLTAILGPHDAQDVQQELWVTVFRKISTLEDPTRFRTWLFRSARRKAIDLLRSEERRLAARRKEATRQIPLAAPESADLDGPEILGVAEALEGLPEIHAEVLRLRYWEGLAYAEIASVVGCTVGTVRSRLFNAKAQLKCLLIMDPSIRPPTMPIPEKKENPDGRDVRGK